MAGKTTPVTINEMKVTKGNLTRMSSTIVAGHPVGKTLPSIFGRRDFEDALDKVSRPEPKPERAR